MSVPEALVYSILHHFAQGIRITHMPGGRLLFGDEVFGWNPTGPGRMNTRVLAFMGGGVLTPSHFRRTRNDTTSADLGSGSASLSNCVQVERPRTYLAPHTGSAE